MRVMAKATMRAESVTVRIHMAGSIKGDVSARAKSGLIQARRETPEYQIVVNGPGGMGAWLEKQQKALARARRWDGSESDIKWGLTCPHYDWENDRRQIRTTCPVPSLNKLSV